ncbi:hypothetical protein MTR_5g083395 [Medicago truncatula]|uniref:Uncharacterized protein n=1 Tax=Medicago truncatula TaxID=3880 RepID=A0A072UF34_MEDTR|nr:hypothetical protein MTR_5g083395 [Medicago truncatula]
MHEAELEPQRVRVADMRNVATAVVKASKLHRELNKLTSQTTYKSRMRKLKEELKEAVRLTEIAKICADRV